MSVSDHALNKSPVFSLLLAQCLLAISVAILLFFMKGMVAGYSALCGGLIARLPNLYLARKAFQYDGARSARLIVRSFYLGEAGKLVLTAALFVLVFIEIKPLSALSLFLGFIATQLVCWVAPLLVTSNKIK